jgi:hypothetical protein
VKIETLSPHQWSAIAQEAHALSFGELRPAAMNRIDFTLLATDGDVPLGYVQGRWADHESVYWQYGGIFPPFAKSVCAWTGFQGFLKKTQAEGCKRVNFLVENTNLPMLKLAMKAGFLIQGVRVFHGRILLDHLLEFEGGT